MSEWRNRIHFGDCLATLQRMPAGVAQTCVTSPPYFGLRDYGHAGQIGLEDTPEAFVARLVEVFRQVRRVLADDGTLWLNIGDSYAGGGGGNYNKTGRTQAGGQHVTNVRNRPEWLENARLKAKDLIGIPWMLAFALRADGWYLRQDLIWAKPNPMPESVTDRCTKAHEYIFLLSKGPRYYFDHEAIKEEARWERWGKQTDRKGITKGANGLGADTRGKPVDMASLAQRREQGRNRRSVWTVATRPYRGAHFATFPPALIEPCILAGSRPGDLVLDPFMGSGTTAQVAMEHGRAYLGCELNPTYKALQDERLRQPRLELEAA